MNLYKILPICSLLFIACSDENSDSIFNVESENFMSSSWIASSSSNSRNDVNSSSSVRNDVSSSSQTVILSSSDNSTSSSTGSSNSSSSATAVAVSSSVTAPTSSSSLIVIPASSGRTALDDLSSSAHGHQGGNLLSSSSRHSGPDPESSSSRNDVNSSSSVRNDVSSSSSIAAFSSSAILAESSSSATVADPTKIFNIRVPDQKFLPCADSIISEYTSEVWIDTIAQSDLICSFDYDGESGFVYVQNNPVACKLYAGVITYEVHKAEFFVNGTQKEISDVKYYGGGNHGIFELQFAYKGKVFRYDYSTMGMGGRPCQNMDCLMVLDADGKTVVQNGCVREERSLPIVCRHAKKDGTFDSFVDTFHVCQSGIFVD